MISVYIHAKYERATSGSWLKFLVCLFASCVVIAHFSGAALYGESIYFTLNFYPLFSSISDHLCTPRSSTNRFVGEKNILCRRAFLFPFWLIFAEEMWCQGCGLPPVVALSLRWLRQNVSVPLSYIYLCDYTKTELDEVFFCWGGFSNLFS